MKSLPFNLKLATDKDGYLTNLDDWNEDVANCIAEHEGIVLTDAHWQIIRCLRKFYVDFASLPTMRALANFVREEIGETQGKSTYLFSLFPDGPVKQGCKIAGLPKPAHCL